MQWVGHYFLFPYINKVSVSHLSQFTNLQGKCYGMGSMKIFSFVFQSIADVTRIELLEQILIK